jgi:hypothetical protein
LVAAARKVFERLGLDVELINVTRAADCSAGTYYTCFSSKEEISVTQRTSDSVSGSPRPAHSSGSVTSA